ncbi:hypothetical protein AVEN_149313-1 [Araneus ventricosus]|uniref:Uncharacterized protein n=1 Tax=Araneus ventricosus TaxID=182803 RepID=A0A4Y2X0K2_ARAVE|nr:hypothetical protein AVEN_149313-1 [Araneus ventricosus]
MPIYAVFPWPPSQVLTAPRRCSTAVIRREPMLCMVWLLADDKENTVAYLLSKCGQDYMFHHGPFPLTLFRHRKWRKKSKRRLKNMIILYPNHHQ